MKHEETCVQTNDENEAPDGAKKTQLTKRDEKLDHTSCEPRGQRLEDENFSPHPGADSRVHRNVFC